MRIPLLIVGDGPHGITGLSRILTDLTAQITTNLRADFEVAVCGYRPWEGLPPQGIEETPEASAGPGRPYKVWAFSDLRRWGAEAVSTAYRYFFGNRPGVLFSIWDPARCYHFPELQLPVARWGYFPVDAHNLHGRLSGPALFPLQHYDRIAAYGEYGKAVLAASLGDTRPDVSIAALPHGLWMSTFYPDAVTPEATRILFPEGHDGKTQVIGCVATNQTRKDWGLFFRVLARLRASGLAVRGWAHVDRDIGEAWSLPQLAADTGCGLLDVRVTRELQDTTLAELYRACAATIAIGRGEGFGYPIVESQACGTPVVHVDYAGGAALTAPEGRLTPAFLAMEGPHALLRPFLTPDVVAMVLHEWLTLETNAAMKQRARAYEHAAPYYWSMVWPRWREWLLTGVAEWTVQRARGDA